MLSTLVNKRESAAALLTQLGRDAKMLHKRGKERGRQIEKRGLAIFLPAGSFCVTKIKSFAAVAAAVHFFIKEHVNKTKARELCMCDDTQCLTSP